MFGSDRWSWLTSLRERRFARRLVKQLLTSHAAVRTAQPELTGEPLYRAVLLHSHTVDPEKVDEVLRDAEESVDAWTAGGRARLGFREVAHFVVMLRHRSEGHAGSLVSFRAIVNSLIPERW